MTILRTTLDLLKHKGQFICKYSQQQAHDWLADENHRILVENALSPYGLGLGVLYEDQNDKSTATYFCQFLSLSDPADFQASVRQLTQLNNEIIPVVKVITALAKTGAFDEQMRPGTIYRFGALLEALEHHRTLKDTLNQLAALDVAKLRSIPGKSSLEDKLKACIGFLTDKGYLVSFGSDSSSYQATGKCFYLNGWLQAMLNLYDIDIPERGTQESAQMGLDL